MKFLKRALQNAKLIVTSRDARMQFFPMENVLAPSVKPQPKKKRSRPMIVYNFALKANVRHTALVMVESATAKDVLQMRKKEKPNAKLNAQSRVAQVPHMLLANASALNAKLMVMKLKQNVKNFVANTIAVQLISTHQLANVNVQNAKLKIYEYCTLVS